MTSLHASRPRHFCHVEKARSSKVAQSEKVKQEMARAQKLKIIQSKATAVQTAGGVSDIGSSSITSSSSTTGQLGAAAAVAAAIRTQDNYHDHGHDQLHYRPGSTGFSRDRNGAHTSYTGILDQRHAQEVREFFCLAVVSEFDSNVCMSIFSIFQNETNRSNV